MSAYRARPVRVPLVLMLAWLTACAPTLPPPSPPDAAPEKVEEVAPPKPSAASEAARQHYAKVQADLLGRGLMRTDGGATDAPFTDTMLAENFIRIALYDEYTRSAQGWWPTRRRAACAGGSSRCGSACAFGASVPADRQATDRARIASFLSRLQRITGTRSGCRTPHPTSTSTSSTRTSAARLAR